MFTHQRQCCRGGFCGDEGVDDDVACVAFDKGDVGQVEIAHLIDAVRHFEEAVDGVQFCLAPEARVHGVGCFIFDEVKARHVPHGIACFIHNLGVGDCADEPV